MDVSNKMRKEYKSFSEVIYHNEAKIVSVKIRSVVGI